MQKNVKRWIAYGIAFALILTSLIPVQSMQAASKPKLNSTKKTMVAGDRTTLKVSSKVKNAKYTWKTSKKSVARVSSKGSVKAVKKGSAVISCSVKVNNKTKYTLKCKITVTDQKVVKTQSELDKALKNSKAAAVILKTSASSKFSIAKGNYTKKALIVDAPNADVENSGVFKSVVIKNIKSDTWTEKANNNKIEVIAKTARIVVDKNASVNTVTCSKSDAAVTLDVKGNVKTVKVVKMADVSVNVSGTVEAVSVDAASAAVDMNVEEKGAVASITMNASAKMNVKAEGKVEGVKINSFAQVTIEGNTGKIPVTVTEAGEGAALTSSVPVEVTASSNVSVKLEKGAEGSAVKTTTDKVEVAVKNDSQTKVTVTTPAGTTDVAAGEATTGSENSGITDSNNNNNNNSGGSDNSGGGGGNTAANKVTGVTLDKDTYELYLGIEGKLTASVKGEGNFAKTVTWTSDNTNVADVADGLITTKGEGTAKITATSTEDTTKKAECTITVKNPTIEMTSTDFSLEAGSTSEKLNIKVTPEDYLSKVIWKSSAENIAAVADGIVTAAAAGTADITASIEIAGQTFTSGVCKVTVTAAGTGTESKYSKVTITKMTQEVYAAVKTTTGGSISVSGAAITATEVASLGAINVTMPNTITQNNEVTATGSLEKDDNKYYLAIQFEVPEGADNMTVTKSPEGMTAEKVTVSGKTYYAVIIPITSKEDRPSVTIDLDGAGTAYEASVYTFNLSGINLN